MMKDECPNSEITEFVGLRSKLYSYKTDDHNVGKRCKGIKRSVVQSTISFEDYKECLFQGTKPMRKMNVIRSHGHQLYSETVNKVALSRDDDKREILIDGIHTLAYGYKNINEYIYDHEKGEYIKRYEGGNDHYDRISEQKVSKSKKTSELI